jgi:hypothetical protein
LPENSNFGDIPQPIQLIEFRPTLQHTQYPRVGFGNRQYGWFGHFSAPFLKSQTPKLSISGEFR